MASASESDGRNFDRVVSLYSILFAIESRQMTTEGKCRHFRFLPAGYIRDNKGWGQERKGGWHTWKATSVFQDPTKLGTRSPRCPELDRNSHRGRAEAYDRVEEGGRREVQNPPGKENLQIAREPSMNVTEYIGYRPTLYRRN